MHAGERGGPAGFDVAETGPGAALVAGSVGTVHRLARRRTDEDDT
ncbi:hypothetical protein [Streptomyces cellulosae]|nr:hypothetical protein [Streptomyces cellulosae]